MGMILDELDECAPTPDGSVLRLEVECRMSRTAEAGPTHPIAIEPDWSLDCHCGSLTCRGRIVPWHELSAPDRERLRPIAMPYLRKQG